MLYTVVTTEIPGERESNGKRHLKQLIGAQGKLSATQQPLQCHSLIFEG